MCELNELKMKEVELELELQNVEQAKFFLADKSAKRRLNKIELRIKDELESTRQYLFFLDQGLLNRKAINAVN